MRALVVDDEAPARSRMRRLLADHGGVEVVGEAHDGASALTAIFTHKPDVVLLDIRMPGLDGITLAQTCRDLPPIIFCTGYDEHAVKAFEVNAVDYLLKPVRPERLAAALARAGASCERRTTCADAGVDSVGAAKYIACDQQQPRRGEVLRCPTHHAVLGR